MNGEEVLRAAHFLHVFWPPLMFAEMLRSLVVKISDRSVTDRRLW